MVVDTTAELARPQAPQATRPIAREPVFRTAEGLKNRQENEEYVEETVDKAPENYPPQNEPVSVLAGFKRPEPQPKRPDHTPISPLPFIQEPPVVFPKEIPPDLPTKPETVKPDEFEDDGISLAEAESIVKKVEEGLEQERKRQPPKTEEERKAQRKRILALMAKPLRPIITIIAMAGVAVVGRENPMDASQAQTGGEAYQPVAEQFDPKLQPTELTAVPDDGNPDNNPPLPPPPIAPHPEPAPQLVSHPPQPEVSATHLVDYTIQPGDSISTIIARLNPQKGYLDESGTFKMDDVTQTQLYNDIGDVISNNPQILEWNPDLAKVIAQETQSLGASPRGPDLKAAVRKVGGPFEVIVIPTGATIKVPSQS